MGNFMKKLKVASYNTSCGFYVGEGEKTEFLDRKQVEQIDTKMLKQTIDYINQEDLDIICFQEMVTMENFDYLGSIAKETQLKYYKNFEVSECHIIRDAKLCISIMSKYPIVDTYTGFFPNPNLKMTTTSGNTYSIFDKGYIICDIDINGEIVRVFNHHGYPFRRFNSTARENMVVFEYFDKVIKEHDPDIIFGDFDTEDFMELTPALNNYVKTTSEATDIDGYKLDNILLRPHILYTSKVVKLLSDHYLVQCEI